MLNSAWVGPVQVKAFVELAGSLLSAGAAKSQAGQPTGLSGEMLRCMRSSGVIDALIGALKLIDMDHPNVSLISDLPCSRHELLCDWQLTIEESTASNLMHSHLPLLVIAESVPQFTVRRR